MSRTLSPGRRLRSWQPPTEPMARDRDPSPRRRGLRLANRSRRYGGRWGVSDAAVCGRIDARLRALRLPGALERYRDLADELGVRDPVLGFLDACLQEEMDSRELCRYERNLRAARFPIVKEPGSFNFAAIPSVSKTQVEELATGRFVAAHETGLLGGGPAGPVDAP